MNFFRFFCLLLLKAFTRRVAEFGDKNYLGACTQGVFSYKVRKERSSKAFKRVYLCFCSKFIVTLMFNNYKYLMYEKEN